MFVLSFLSAFVFLRTGSNHNNPVIPRGNCLNETEASVNDEINFIQRRLLMKNYYRDGDYSMIDEYNDERFFERVRKSDDADEEDDGNEVVDEEQTEDSPQEYFDYDAAEAKKFDDGYEDVDVSGTEDKILIKGFCNVILMPSLLLLLISQDLSITNAISDS